MINLTYLQKLSLRRKQMYKAFLLTKPGTENRKHIIEVMNGYLALNKIVIVFTIILLCFTSCRSTYKSRRLHKEYITCPTYH